MAKKGAKGSGGGFGSLLVLVLVGLGLAGATDGGASAGGDPGEIPPAYLAAYQAAAGECPALDWELLAAIGYVESRHGANGGTSSAGAVGPMQFMPPTWAIYGGGSAYDIDDAAEAAARYLCAAGLAEGDHRRAIFAYNHSWGYVDKVQAQADAYRG